MAKKSTKKVQPPPKKQLPKRILKPKKKQSQDIEIPISDEEPDSLNSDSSQFFQSDEDMSDENGSGQSEESSSISSVKPQNYAIKQMTFRSRRGTKMNYLINRKKQQEDDPFWQQQGANYFGNLDDGDADSEQYSQSSSGRDIFDSDFGDTQSEHNDQQKEEKKFQDDDQDKAKEKKKKIQLMKKINTKSTTSKVKPKVEKPEKTEEVGNRYIHQLFTQEQLLGQAAHTQYENWVSLKKLISIETEKKDFTRKEKHVDGNKLVYRDRLQDDGTRQVTYQLHGVNVQQIQDLTKYWNAN